MRGKWIVALLAGRERRPLLEPGYDGPTSALSGRENGFVRACPVLGSPIEGAKFRRIPAIGVVDAAIARGVAVVARRAEVRRVEVDGGRAVATGSTVGVDVAVAADAGVGIARRLAAEARFRAAVAVGEAGVVGDRPRRARRRPRARRPVERTRPPRRRRRATTRDGLGRSRPHDPDRRQSAQQRDQVRPPVVADTRRGGGPRRRRRRRGDERGRAHPRRGAATPFRALPPHGVGRRSGLHGTGLGLYILRELVVAHGGEITCDSDACSTTFRFTVPRTPSLDQRTVA